MPSKKVDEFVRDPVTGALLRKEEAKEHMKRQFIDQQYKINKQKELEKFKTTNIADNAQLASYLNSFAESRSDIFGGKKKKEGKKEEEAAQDGYLWDGRKKTAKFAPKVSSLLKKKLDEELRNKKEETIQLPPPPMMSLPPPPTYLSDDAHESIQRKAQQAAYAAAQARGLLVPGPPPGGPSQPFGQPLPYGLGHPPMPVHPSQMPPPMTNFLGNKAILSNFRSEARQEDQPIQKKRKVGLISEEEWLNKYSGTVTVQILVPSLESIEAMKGQTETVELDMKDKVFEIAKELSNRLGVSRGKIRLNSLGVGFLKASKTLGFYNFSRTHTLELVLKKKRR